MRHKTMIRAWILVGVLLAASGIAVLSAPAYQAQPGAIDAKQLKQMIEGLGYEVKYLNETEGKEKYEFTVVRGELDIPIAAEISASKNFVWLTVFLGEAPKDTDAAAKLSALLKENAKVQPTQFYITSAEKLMLGFAMENRSLTSAVLRRTVDKFATDVVDTQDLW